MFEKSIHGVITLMAFIELIALLSECTADDIVEAEYEEVDHE